ncbi:HEAT repeat domain-containing protein [Nonomuraea antimicrobica]
MTSSAWSSDLLPPLPEVPEPALTALADDPRQDVRRRLQAATALLEQAAPGAVPTLVELATARGGDVRVRFEAARVLAQSARPSVLTGLRALAADPKVRPTLRYEAAALLADHGDQEGLGVLRDLTGTATPPSARFRAVRTLLERGDLTGLKALRLLTTDERTSLPIRLAAGRLLLDHEDEPTRDALRRMLEGGARLPTRYGAALALGDPAALRELAEDPRVGPYARHGVGLALLRAGDPLGKDVLRALATRSPHTGARLKAARTLSRYDRAEGVAALRAVLDETGTHGRDRHRAALALLELDEKVDLAHLAAQTPDAALRVTIGDTMQVHGDPAGLAVLREVVSDARVKDHVRHQAAVSLTAYGAPGVAVLREVAESVGNEIRGELVALSRAKGRTTPPGSWSGSPGTSSSSGARVTSTWWRCWMGSPASSRWPSWNGCPATVGRPIAGFGCSAWRRWRRRTYGPPYPAWPRRWSGWPRTPGPIRSYGATPRGACSARAGPPRRWPSSGACGAGAPGTPSPGGWPTG